MDELVAVAIECNHQKKKRKKKPVVAGNGSGCQINYVVHIFNEFTDEARSILIADIILIKMMSMRVRQLLIAAFIYFSVSQSFAARI